MPLRLAPDIGSRLRELREALDWTQEDLGKELGRARQSVVHWEAGRVRPPRRPLVELCRRHHWPMEMFADGGPRPRQLLLSPPNGAPPEAPMAEFSAAVSVATLRTELRYIDAKLNDGSLSPESLAELKSAVDDVRLRLWGALLANTPEDYAAFRQGFRVIRATEICRGLVTDLEDGTLPWTHPELATLAEVAAQLAVCVTAGPR